MNIFEILLLLLLGTFSKQIQPHSKDKELVSLSECVLNGLKLHLKNGNHITLVLPYNTSSFINKRYIVIEKLAMESKWPLIITNLVHFDAELKFLLGLPNTYLIFIQNVEDIMQSIKLLWRQKFWNPHAKVLAISSKIVNDNQQEASEVFEVLRHDEAFDVVLFIPDGRKLDTFHIYTSPRVRNCGKTNSVKLTDTCSRGNLEKHNPWYKNKKSIRFNNCTLNVGTVNATDNEKQLAAYLAKVLNLTFLYKSYNTSSRGTVYENGTFTHSFQDLLRNHIDILMGGLTVT